MMVNEFIKIENARENNLKGINCQIPKGKITVFTGVSGSGKSSLVFDTIAQEAGRQLNETYDSFTRRFLPKFKRPEVDDIINLSPAIVINQKRIGGNARSTLGTITDINSLLRLLFSRFSQPHLGNSNSFSFNDPAGMCPKCEGIGSTIEMNLDAALDKSKSLNEGAIQLPGMGAGTYYWKLYVDSGLFNPDKKIKDYTPEELELFLYADAQKIKDLAPNSKLEMNTTYEGLATRFMRTNVKTEKEITKRSEKFFSEFTVAEPCSHCHGKRYNDIVLGAKVNDYTIYDLTAMQLDDLLEVLKGMEIPQAEGIIKGLIGKIKSLCDIGLGYMMLTRETTTLSGGESQRVKMVKYLSSNLTGMIYIFDEPSTGLHPRDVHRLNELLVQIRDRGNTVLVVEHDPDVIKIADYIIDMGPFAGSKGGEIMFQGSFENLLLSDTLTGRCLKEKREIKTAPRKSDDFYISQKSSLHNLKNVSLRIPKGIFTVVTGVAGSGKSTLVNEAFLKEFPESICVNQNPIHTNRRSNPLTYMGIMNDIRNLFAKENNVSNKLFSYNSEGACEACGGKGVVELNLSFMENTEVECEVCQGTRFKQEVLKYSYHEKNIVDIMDMTIADAIRFFDDNKIRKKLKSMETVGLEYLTLGQPLNTLSGGECQRLKLANELHGKGNIYILDEPTTGLHFSDIGNILNIIDELVKKGNTVIVIEHNTDVIRQADWVIDIGIDGGTAGGNIVFEGTVEQLKQCENSITAKYI